MRLTISSAFSSRQFSPISVRNVGYNDEESEMNTEVKNLAELQADEVIVATGAKARKIPIPGVEKAVEAVLDKNYRTGDIMSAGCTQVGCTQMGDLLAAEI